MATRVLIINGERRALAARLAEQQAQPARWFIPSRGDSPPGNDPANVLHLDSFRCVFSYTQIPGEGLYRHLSVSVGPGVLPNVPFVAQIAGLFGFTGQHDECVLAKDWLIDTAGSPTPHVIVAQKIRDADGLPMPTEAGSRRRSPRTQ